jgi:hypothetical protein
LSLSIHDGDRRGRAGNLLLKQLMCANLRKIRARIVPALEQLYPVVPTGCRIGEGFT